MDPSETYRLLVWRPTCNITGSQSGEMSPKVFDVAGDHLTIARLVGPMPILCRLGDDPNPWIRVFSRMVLKRKFNRVSFVMGNYSPFLLGNTAVDGQVLAYASNGPLVEFPEREHGLKRAPVTMRDLVATTVKTDLGDILVAQSNSLPTQIGPTAGLEGGTLLITNTGGVNLYVEAMGLGTLVSANPGYGPILPGTSVSLELDDMVFKYAAQRDNGGLALYTLTGTTTFAIILSGSDRGVWDGMSTAERNPA